MKTCDSCARECVRGDTRARCKRCGTLVHHKCRDITEICYSCRYRQACEGGIAGPMVPAQQAGENPFKTNMPATAIRGVPLPELASVQNLYGASVNGLRIATHALYLGWHIEAWKCWTDRFTLRKYGRGYLRLVLSSSGRIIRADTQRQYLTPNTAHVLTYLEEK